MKISPIRKFINKFKISFSKMKSIFYKFFIELVEIEFDKESDDEILQIIQIIYNKFDVYDFKIAFSLKIIEFRNKNFI